MTAERDQRDLEDAIRRAEAGVKALQAAQRTAAKGSIYPAHVQVAAVELAHAIELAIKVALRNP